MCLHTDVAHGFAEHTDDIVEFAKGGSEDHGEFLHDFAFEESAIFLELASEFARVSEKVAALDFEPMRGHGVFELEIMVKDAAEGVDAKRGSIAVVAFDGAEGDVGEVFEILDDAVTDGRDV